MREYAGKTGCLLEFVRTRSKGGCSLIQVRRIGFVGLILFGVVVGVMGTSWLSRWFAPRWDGGIVMEKIIPIAEVATVQGTVFAYLTHEDVGLKQAAAPRLFGKQFLIVQKAQVKMGFKLTDWDSKANIEHNPITRTITIWLPPAEIIALEPQYRSKKVMSQEGLLGDRDLSPEETIEIDMKLDDLFRKSDSLPMLREQARQSFQYQVEKLLAPYELKASVVIK